MGRDSAGLVGEEFPYTKEILAHASTVQDEGWDIDYRASG